MPRSTSGRYPMRTSAGPPMAGSPVTAGRTVPSARPGPSPGWSRTRWRSVAPSGGLSRMLPCSPSTSPTSHVSRDPRVYRVFRDRQARPAPTGPERMAVEDERFRRCGAAERVELPGGPLGRRDLYRRARHCALQVPCAGGQRSMRPHRVPPRGPVREQGPLVQVPQGVRDREGKRGRALSPLCTRCAESYPQVCTLLLMIHGTARNLGPRLSTGVELHVCKLSPVWIRGVENVMKGRCRSAGPSSV